MARTSCPCMIVFIAIIYNTGCLCPYMIVLTIVQDRSRPCETVHEVHSTSVHIRFDTLPYALNTVQVRIIRGQIRSVRSSTGMYTVSRQRDIGICSHRTGIGRFTNVVYIEEKRMMSTTTAAIYLDCAEVVGNGFAFMSRSVS